MTTVTTVKLTDGFIAEYLGYVEDPIACTELLQEYILNEDSPELTAVIVCQCSAEFWGETLDIARQCFTHHDSVCTINRPTTGSNA